MSKQSDAPDLSVEIAGVRLRNPVIAASGTFGYGREYAKLIDVSRLGGICTKGLTLAPRPGNSGVRLWETDLGLLNSIGLENPGIPAFIRDELPHMTALGPAIIANLSGSTVDEYAEGAALLDESPVDMVELNISCPNVKEGGMAFGLWPEAAAAVVSRVRAALKSKPLMVKLSPNASDIPAVAKACLSAGADAFSLVNTFSAMAIDVKKRRPAFDNVTAGLSGPAIRPLAIRMVWELCGELGPGVPVVGMGGIARTEDALEFMMAGSWAVQVGTATFARPGTMIEVIDGIGEYMREAGVAGVAGIRLRR